MNDDGEEPWAQEEEEVEEVEEEEEELDGRDVLFEALNNDVDLEGIRSIVEAHPDSVQCDPDPETNLGWCSALTMVIGLAGEYEEVRYLASQHPDAVKTRDHLGRLPLHLAIMYRARLPVIRMLVEMYPDALQEPINDKSGHLPMHCAFLNGYAEFGYNELMISVGRLQRPEVITYLIEQNPAAVRVRTSNGYLPLHLAFANDDGEPWLGDPVVPRFVDPDAIAEEVSVEVIGALLEAWPDSAMQTDPCGRLPLHLACQSPKTRPDVIRRLVEDCPTAVRRRDVKNRNLPIHHAILSGMPIDSVSVLAEAWAPSIVEPSDEGNSALHLHLLNLGKRREDQQIELLRLLVSHSSVVVQMEGGSGDIGVESRLLPLHLAVIMEAPLDVIRFLVREWRKALNVKTATGWLPLHLAARHSNSPDIVRFLVEECPQSARATTDDMLLALHVAARDSRRLDIVAFVHQTWPDALREKSKMGCTPLHFAATRSFWRSQGPVGVKIIRYFLSHWPRAVEETTWSSGSLPLHFAADEQASSEAVRLLIERGPKPLLLVRRHDDGTVPLHGAASRDRDPAALKVVQILAEQSPEALQVADHRGFLPLHTSVRSSGGPICSQFWKCKMPVVRHLVKAFPQALEVKDMSGRIPLLVAAEADAPLEVLLYLLTSGPLSIGGYGRRHHRWTPSPSKRPRLS